MNSLLRGFARAILIVTVPTNIFVRAGIRNGDPHSTTNGVIMSLKEVFQQNPNRRYIMFGGKGGLGKTTFSAATAYWLAQQGHKVLVFSVDPQASLSDIFQKDIFGKGAVKIMDNLWAQEIDADSHIKTYQNEIRQKILDMYGIDKVPEEIEDYIQEIG